MQEIQVQLSTGTCIYFDDIFCQTMFREKINQAAQQMNEQTTTNVQRGQSRADTGTNTVVQRFSLSGQVE